MDSDGRVGPAQASDGAKQPMRLGRSGDVIANAHGAMGEETSRGNRYSASVGTGGVAPGTALSTTPPFDLWNPVGSGVDLVVDELHASYISGTLGAGTLYAAYVASQATEPSTGTTITPRANRVGGARGKGNPGTGRTVAATPTPLHPVASLGAKAAATAAGVEAATVRVDGGIVVPPGACLVLQAVAAAGTSPIMDLGATWHETPAS